MEADTTVVGPFTLSFMSANYVARELGYGAADEWGPFDDATNAAFEPLEHLRGALRRHARADHGAAGFDAIDLWFGHLNWRWATPDHVAIARETLDRHGIRVVSLAGGIGTTAADVEAACRLANAPRRRPDRGPRRDRPARTATRSPAVLDAHGVRFGLENHPERTPSEVLAAIGDAEALGAAVEPGGGRPRATTRSRPSTSCPTGSSTSTSRTSRSRARTSRACTAKGAPGSPTASRRCSTSATPAP